MALLAPESDLHAPTGGFAFIRTIRCQVTRFYSPPMNHNGHMDDPWAGAAKRRRSVSCFLLTTVGRCHFTATWPVWFLNSKLINTIFVRIYCAIFESWYNMEAQSRGFHNELWSWIGCDPGFDHRGMGSVWVCLFSSWKQDGKYLYHKEEQKWFGLLNGSMLLCHCP